MNYINILFLNIIKTSLVASVLILIIILLRFVFQKKIKTNYIYIMWIILLVRLVVPFGFESSISVENIMFSDEIVEKYEGVIEEKIPKEKEEVYDYYYKENQPKVEIPEIADKTISVLSIIWIFGILVILFIPIITYFTLLRELRKSKTPIEDSISKASIEANRDIGIYKRFSIVKSTLIDSPSLIGLKKPMIILPKNHNKEYEDNYKIFLHEYIHYDKKHLLFQWIFWILKAVYWFNPLIWIAHYLMKQDAEYVCDEKAVEVIGNHEEYGNLILDIADNTSSDNYMINTVGFSYKKKELRNRIMRIMNKNKNHIILRIICIICTVLIIPVFFTSYHEIEKQVEALEFSRELNEIGSNDIIDVKILKYEYSSDTGKLFVDLEYEIDEEFTADFSEEEICPKFDIKLLFLGSKDPEIRNNEIGGDFYSEKDNIRRFSFYIGKYDFERFGNPVFKIKQIELDIDRGEEIHEIDVKNIPADIKFHNIIDISVKKLEIEDNVSIDYIIRGYKNKIISTSVNIYGEIDGHKVRSISGGGTSSILNANDINSEPYDKVSEDLRNMQEKGVFTYCEENFRYNNFEYLSKDKIYIGVGGFDIELLDKPIDFRLNIGDNFINE